MLYTGLVSISFRALSALEIIQLCHRANVAAIEWGADVHVPVGQSTVAKLVGYATRDAGIRIASYGSYFSLGNQSDFLPVIETAIELGALNVRIWAGKVPSRLFSAEQRLTMAEELAKVADLAETAGLTVSLEYHQDSFADDAAVVAQLLQDVGRKNLRTYWQMLPERSAESYYDEITLLLPWLSHVHVFNWQHNPPSRHSLAQATDIWRRVLSVPLRDQREHGAFLEYLPYDNPNLLRTEYNILRDLVDPAG